MRLLAACLLLLASVCTAQAGEVLVAVASNFAPTFARLSAAFTRASGHRVRSAAAATGKFRAQITAGAPYEVLLAADTSTPQALIAAGHGVAGTDFTYAVGRLVLWSPEPGRVDERGAALAEARFRHLAIANPKVAPYGRAAMEVLQARGLAAALAPKLVIGESMAQAFQFVSSGNADLGFVALAQVAGNGQPARGSYWVVPQALYGEIRQDAVLLKAGADKPAARALLAFLRSEAARTIVRGDGYGP